MRRLKRFVTCLAGWVWLPLWVQASDPKGLALVRSWAPEWDGTGVAAAQPEAGDPIWQVSPAATGQPVGMFTWVSSGGSSTQFPNALGMESAHANEVAAAWYGLAGGVSPKVSRVINYEASHFYSIIQARTSIPATIINQSFVFGAQIPTVDQDFDSFAERYGSLFVSGVGNGGPPRSPATCYNGIAVGTLNANSSIGPTTDGRCKPDLVAEASFTSFSTPMVAGSAALMLEAITNGAAGSAAIAAASDYRTLKALLLNGATKPPGWTNGTTAPLDARFGTGELEVFATLRQLVGGRHAPGSTSNYTAGAQDHRPAPGTSSVPARRGWDLRTINSTMTQDQGNHYQFDLTSPAGKVFALTATLVWSRAQNATAINDLDLFLYHAQSGSLMASSQSSVNNVEHLHITGLSQGSYVLQVLKYGGLVKRVTNQETYALAFDFGPPEIPRWENLAYTSPSFQAVLCAEPFELYAVQGTSDLLNWIPIGTNAMPATGQLPFSHTVTMVPPARFFRAILAH